MEDKKMEAPKNLKFQGVRMSDREGWRRFVEQSGLRNVSSCNHEAVLKTAAKAVYKDGVTNPLTAEWRRNQCGQGNIKPVITPREKPRAEASGRGVGGFLHGMYNSRKGEFLR